MKAIFAVSVLFLSSIPALTGFVDTVWWFYTNHALTSIDWTGSRPLLAYSFAAIGFLTAMRVMM